MAGAIVTAIIQSSSASVGILQALSLASGISYAVAIPIILGMAVMFTDFRNSKKNLSEQTNLKYLILLISGIFILAFSYLILTSNALNPMDISFDVNTKNASIQVINTFSRKIFI